MDFLATIFDWVWKSLAGIGILAFGAGYWRGQLQKGSKEANAEKQHDLEELRKALETANANAEAWKLSSERKDADIAEMRGEMSRLKSEMAALSAKVETYESLIGGKEISPAMMKIWEKFSSSITEQFKGLGLSMDSMAQQLIKIEQHTRPTRKSAKSVAQ